MVDRTVYDEDKVPALALRQIFGRQRLPEAMCKLAASSGLLSVERFAMLGDTLADMKASFVKIVRSPDALGADDAQRELHLTCLASVWKTCSVLQDQFAVRRAKMEEDPTKIPEIPQEDHSEYRERFVKDNPNFVLTVWREPHKKLVERINRDFLVHGSIPFYEVGELRVRGETIAQRSGLSASADDILRIAKVDEPTKVGTEEEVVNRVTALFVALDYLNVCAFTLAAGPVLYLRMLEEFRNEHPGMSFLLKADKLVRKKVATVAADNRSDYPSFSAALLEVLNNRRYLWNDARSEVEVVRYEQALGRQGISSAPSASSGAVPRAPPLAGSPRQDRNAGRKKRQQARRKAPKAPAPTLPVKRDSTGAQKAPSNPRVPQKEWQALVKVRGSGKPKCLFFNSSVGCKFGDTCGKEHRCSECGGEHSWAHTHFRA